MAGFSSALRWAYSISIEMFGVKAAPTAAPRVYPVS